MTDEERQKAVADGKAAHAALDRMLDETRRDLIGCALRGSYIEVLNAQERIDLLLRARQDLVNAELSLTYGQR